MPTSPYQSSIAGPFSTSNSVPVLAANGGADLGDNTLNADLNGTLFAQVITNDSLWNANFPYRLLILSQEPSSSAPYTTIQTFDLPINPEALEITTNFAINETVTLNGIIEQHNAFPIINIAMSGSTGFLNGTNIRAPDTTMPNFGIFAGSLNKLASTTSQLKSLLTTQSNSALVNVSDNSVTLRTGYARFLALRNFLESYAILKKSKDNANLRLGLAIFKEAYVYVCTPKVFRLKRNVESPHEFKYDLQLNGWQRFNSNALHISTGGGRASFVYGGGLNGPANGIKTFGSGAVKLLNNVQRARGALALLGDTVTSVSADLNNNVFGIARQMSLGLKDLGGVVVALTDLPVQIVHDLAYTLIYCINNFKSTFTSMANAAAGVSQQAANDFNAIKDYYNQQILLNPNPSGTALSSNNPGPLVNNSQLRTNVDRIFNNAQAHSQFFEQITLGQITNIPPAVQDRINAEIARVRGFTVSDYQNMRSQLQSASNTYAQAVGASSSTFIAQYGLGSVNQIRSSPTSDDYAVLASMDDLILALNKLIVSGQSTTNNTTPNNVTYIAALANASNIDFTIPRSKFPVPFPYGGSLERLALQYLGTPDRWYEIATINGLRSPYVDEIGFTISLVGIGNDKSITLPTATNLVVGQTVWLASNTVPVQSYVVQQITNMSNDSWIVQLNAPTSMYRDTDNAYLQSFLPYTINSQSNIYIPSPKDPQGVDTSGNANSNQTAVTQIFDNAGMDLLLDPNGDLIVTTDGDCRWATGITNIVQIIRILLSTAPGSLVHHPEFGAAFVGISLADTNASTIATAVKKAIDNDQFFKGWRYNVTVNMVGPSANVTIQLNLDNSNTTIPISFTLNPT